MFIYRIKENSDILETYPELGEFHYYGKLDDGKLALEILFYLLRCDYEVSITTAQSIVEFHVESVIQMTYQAI